MVSSSVDSDILRYAYDKKHFPVSIVEWKGVVIVTLGIIRKSGECTQYRKRNKLQSELIDATTTRGCTSFVRSTLFSYFSRAVTRGGGGMGRKRVAKYSLHITARERYIPDKSYWLVSSFNGNVVPLNGVRAELKRKGKNKGMKYKPGAGGKEMAIDR